MGGKMPNGTLIVLILLLIGVGVTTYRQTKNAKKTAMAVFATFVVAGLIATILDLFME